MPGLLPISKMKSKEEKRTSNCQSRSKKNKKQKEKDERRYFTDAKKKCVGGLRP